MHSVKTSTIKSVFPKIISSVKFLLLREIFFTIVARHLSLVKIVAGLQWWPCVFCLQTPFSILKACHQMPHGSSKWQTPYHPTTSGTGAHAPAPPWGLGKCCRKKNQ